MLHLENKIGNKKLRKDLNSLAESEVYNTIIYLCKKCSSSILIKNLYYHVNKKKIYLECECFCRRIYNYTINEFYNEFEYKEYEQSTDIIIINNIKCFEHEEAKFEYYCTDCEKDLCINCIGEIHPNHTFISFNINIINHLNEKINESMGIEDKNGNSNNNNQRGINNNDNSNETFFNKENFTIKDIDIQSKKSLKNLLDRLISFYSIYPCYNIDKSIKNISKFCSNISKYLIENESYKALDIIKKRKIRFPWEFYKIPENENIISIHLIEQGLRKIIGLAKYNLENLEELSLRNNNLTDISPLADKKFPNLKTLCLEENKITDENYEVFKQLDAPNLIFINLFKNQFHSPKIFTTLKRFEKLEKFFIGNNKIDAPYDIIYDCSHMIEIGLSIGVFSENTIEKISNFKFDNLKILYLNSNNIHSLSFIKSLNCKNLEEIWFMNNYIESFIELERFKNLKIINLKKNKIKDISKLEEFVNKLPNLEKIILSENKIDKETNIKILSKIKERQIKIEL